MPSATRVRRFDAVTDELIESYRRDGFVVLDQALSPGQVTDLHTAAEQLCRGDLGAVGGVPAARPTDAEPTDDVLRRFLCIHHPHKVSDAALAALHAPSVVEALTALIGPNVKAMQSMLFIKPEGKPGQAWHQDEFFIPTRDRSLTAAWIALDDATVENGCLWVLPGSHQRGVIYPDREQDDLRFDCTVEAFDFPYSDDDAVPVEVPAGSAVIFNGYLLHRSLPNTGRHGLRRALANHYMSAESLLPWQSVPDGVHVGKHDYRDIVMVAGTDPYAYKGIDDIARPHSRPDKDGGCDR
ncbi:phytanoyl-CoA dioxygenase family protein [Kribbella sp. NPDC003557]|uniref:phytanoyl-CoA dioxygenase family protein n=1 Tax=Kribbella sp. NPDC003557 TaxID=3154449 RepID=UPI0033AD3B36